MPETDTALDRVRQLLPASRGAGPLLQRDYWAVIERSRLSPPEVVSLVAARFPAFAPEDLVVFSRRRGEGPLEVGDELDVRIRGAGTVGVRVTHRDRNSFTLATLEGHPEAGRITFGAYRNARGDVLFHVRSRARSSTRLLRAGFLVAGDPMQTNTWTDFVNRVAITVGHGVLGAIHAETTRGGDEPETDDLHRTPTYVARGD